MERILTVRKCYSLNTALHWKFILLLSIVAREVYPIEVKACEGSTASLSCTSSITVTEAKYGRTTSGCNVVASCRTDVTSYVGTLCDNRASCSVPSSNSITSSDPCPSQSKSLKIEYDCGPVNGNWGNWGGWGTCTKTCDTGTRTRTRSCNNPSPQYGGSDCGGSDSDSVNCNIRYCPGTSSSCGSPSDGLLMYKSVSSLTSTLTSNSGYTYLMSGDAFGINCCGVITEWKIYAEYYGTIEFIIFTYSSNLQYVIKSIQSVTLTSSDDDQVYTYSIPSADRVAIFPTDRIGWRTGSTDMIPNTNCDDHNLLWCPTVYYKNYGSISVGQTINFNSAFSSTTKGYAIQVYSGNNNPVAFAETSYSTEIADNTDRGTSLFSYTMTGIDPGEVAVFTWAGDHDYFYHDETNAIISMVRDFEPATIKDSYEATMEAADGCVTATITLSVSVYNTWFGCDQRDSIKYNDTAILGTTNDTNTGKLYIMMDDVFDIKCCGVIYGWSFYPIASGDIEFVVFKHTSGTTYEIKAFNSYTVTDDDVIDGSSVFFNITETDRITIENGDRIGWRCTGANLIPYATCDFAADPDCPMNNIYFSSSGTLSEGSTFSTSSGTTLASRAYAIEVHIMNNTILEFSRDLFYAKLPKSTSVNTVLATYSMTGVDNKDEVTFESFVDTYFTHDEANSRIKLKSGFVSVTSQSIYTKELIASDLCQYTATTTISVDTYEVYDDCEYGALFNYSDPSVLNTDADTGTDNMYLMKDDNYKVSCCGVISAWEFFPKVAGTIHFMVWKHDSGLTYTLRGFNTILITAADVAAAVSVNYTVPSEFRIAFEDSDRIGWKTTGSAAIGNAPCDTKTDGLCPTLTLKTTFTGTVEDEMSFDWSDGNVTTVPGIGYSIRAYSVPNVKIAFGGISEEGYEGAVANHMPIGTSLLDYIIENIDYKETIVISFSHTHMELNESFSFIQSKATFPHTSETYKATMTVTGSCDHSISTLITLDTYNGPPIIRNLPRSISIFDDAEGNTHIFQLDVYDPTVPPDPVCCELSRVSPQTTNFNISLINSTYFNFTLIDKPIFSYKDVNSYLVYVCCEDPYGTTSNYLKVGIKQRPKVELYTPPSWFYTSIIISIIPITIMLVMAFGLMCSTMFFSDDNDLII